MKKLNFKLLIVLAIFAGFLGGCAGDESKAKIDQNANEPIDLKGTRWVSSHNVNNYIYKEYFVFTFEADKILIKTEPVQENNYFFEGYVNYKYDPKTCILKLENTFYHTKQMNNDLPTPSKIPLETSFFILKGDGKQTAKDGIKVTKNTKVLNLNYLRKSLDNIQLKRVK